MDTSRETTPTLEALALLPVPDWSDLSEQQGRGTICVWCGSILTPAIAVSLGVRRIRVLDGHLDTFPRACRPCMRTKSQQAAKDHPGMCESCADNPALCDTAQALRRLVRKYTR